MRKEHDEQVLVVRYLRSASHVFCAIPNGARTSIRTAVKLKAEGLEKGAPDILIFDAPPNEPAFIGTALEMKREKGGHTSDEQKDWHIKLAARGWKIIIGKGAVNALNQLARLGYRVPQGNE